MSYFDKNSDAPSLLRVIAYIFLVFLFTIYSLDFVRSAQLTAFYIPLAFLLALRLPRAITKILLVLNIWLCSE